MKHASLRRIASGDNPTMHFRKPKDLAQALASLFSDFDSAVDSGDENKRRVVALQNARLAIVLGITEHLKTFDFTFGDKL